MSPPTTWFTDSKPVRHTSYTNWLLRVVPNLYWSCLNHYVPVNGRCLLSLCCKNKTSAPLLCEVVNKRSIKQESCPSFWDKPWACLKSGLLEVLPCIYPTVENLPSQWQLISAFSWCCFRWLWSACPTTAFAGGCKRACFPRSCPYARMPRKHFCTVFSKNFNIMSALSVHQSPTQPQKIDSREGLFWCKKGLVVNAGKMNTYCIKPQFAPALGPFFAKFAAFCRKMQCNLVQNAVQFGAKRSAFWC